MSAIAYSQRAKKRKQLAPANVTLKFGAEWILTNESIGVLRNSKGHAEKA